MDNCPSFHISWPSYLAVHQLTYKTTVSKPTHSIFQVVDNPPVVSYQNGSIIGFGCDSTTYTLEFLPEDEEEEITIQVDEEKHIEIQQIKLPCNARVKISNKEYIEVHLMVSFIIFVLTYKQTKSSGSLAKLYV